MSESRKQDTTGGVVTLDLDDVFGPEEGKALGRAPPRLRYTGRDPDALPPNVRDAWHERVAICLVDGGLDEHAAQEVAWQEVDGAVLSET